MIPASAVRAIWVHKHGARIFTRPLADITRYWQGIPFLAPEVVLLIKARPGTDRPGTDNDQRDFEAALPMLSAEQRSWLKDAIERRSGQRHHGRRASTGGQQSWPPTLTGQRETARAKRSLAAGFADVTYDKDRSQIRTGSGPRHGQPPYLAITIPRLTAGNQHRCPAPQRPPAQPAAANDHELLTNDLAETLPGHLGHRKTAKMRKSSAQDELRRFGSTQSDQKGRPRALRR